MNGFARFVFDQSEGPSRAWLSGALEQLSGPHAVRTLGPLFARCKRQLGNASSVMSLEVRRGLSPHGGELHGDWTFAELARAALLCTALDHLEPETHLELVRRTFQRGETDERRAVLRSLCHLPGASRFLPLAVDSARTHVLPVFEALACENPYPQQHFPDAAFNQLVMKAVFSEIALGRIIGLRERSQPELLRMAIDYAAERRAAGRSVPRDLAQIPGFRATL